MKFDHRTAVITGGAGNIGRATAEQLVSSGVKTALVDIDLAKAETAASELRSKGADIRAYGMDVRSKESVAAAASQILADFGRVDILINNAGVWRPSLFSETTDEQWEDMIDLNLSGTFRVTKAFLPSMLENGYGRIINLGSIAGEVGLPKYCGYSAAKAGVIMMTKVMAMELAKKNITVNSVSPGMIGFNTEPTKTTWVERWGRPDEVANVIMFLASDETSFITGSDYSVDGGRILGPRFADV